MKATLFFFISCFLLLGVFNVDASSIPVSPSLKGGGRGGGFGGRGGSGGRGAGTGRGGSGNTGQPAVAPAGANGRVADYFSPGGGKPFVVSSESPFAGRQIGGGVRAQVPGTPRYASGYPYHSGDPRSQGVFGQPFPFGFWPIYWAGHGRSDEYGQNSTVISQRPGGNLTYIQLAPKNTTEWNATAVNGINETYWMIGDQQSVITLLTLLVDPQNNDTSPYGCNVQNLGPYSFTSEDNASLPFRFENVVQWYRSSSFALAYQGYENAYALAPLNETTGLGWNESTPLPSQQLSSPFLRCINATITASLPILNGPSGKLSTGAIIGITLGSIFGSLIIFTVICCFFGGNTSCTAERKRRKEERKKEKREDLAEKLTRIKSEYHREIQAASRKNTIEFPTSQPNERDDYSKATPLFPPHAHISPPTQQDWLLTDPAKGAATPSPYSYSSESGRFSDEMVSDTKHTQYAMSQPKAF